MKKKAPSVAQLRKSMDEYIVKISEGHRMHRKIQFLLDVRGLLIINHISGDYVEFGVYRAEMMYAASKILGKNIKRLIGLDTFAGLPEPYGDDAASFVFETQGFMAATKSMAEDMLKGCDRVMIEGDFRKKAVMDEYRSVAGEIAVLTIDCNWPSSVRAALSLAAPYLRCGSILFLDDYFVGTRKANFHREIMQQVGRVNNMRFIEFATYPPCARAFLIETDESRAG